MAKTLKKVVQVVLKPDGTGLSYGECEVAYEVGSDDDASLSKTVVQTYTLSGDDLTDATSIWDSCKAQAQSDEGI